MTASAPVSNSAMSEQEVEAFTFGDCWRLALAMRQRWRLPVVFFAGVNPDAVVLDDVTMWCHVLNDLGDGRYVDVAGIHTLEQVHERWDRHLWLDEGAEARVVEPSPGELGLMLSGQWVEYPEVDAALCASRLGHQWGVSRLRRQAMRGL